MKFKIGDKVILREESLYKRQQNGIGTIVRLQTPNDSWIRIRWENNDTNDYPPEDVILKVEVIEKQINNLKLFIQKDNITITDEENDVITLKKDDLKEIIKEINKK